VHTLSERAGDIRAAADNIRSSATRVEVGVKCISLAAAHVYAGAARISIPILAIDAMLARIYVARRCVCAARANANKGTTIID